MPGLRNDYVAYFSQGRVKRKAVIDEERLLWKRGIIPYHIYEDHFCKFFFLLYYLCLARLREISLVNSEKRHKRHNVGWF